MAGYGPKNSQWKGGRKLNNGYVLILMPEHPRSNVDGYVREHVLIVEEYLGRPLPIDGVIHHVNGNRSDNRIENLEVMTQSAHISLHRRKEKAADYERCDNWLDIWRTRRKSRTDTWPCAAGETKGGSCV